MSETKKACAGCGKELTEKTGWMEFGGDLLCFDCGLPTIKIVTENIEQVPGLLDGRDQTALYIGARLSNPNNRAEGIDGLGFLENAGYAVTILEAFYPNVTELRAEGLDVIWGDVRNAESILPKSYDLIFWWHGPEHAAEKELPEIFAALKRCAKKLLVVGTPDGFYVQDNIYGNSAERHLCGLSAEKLGAFGIPHTIRGFRSFGLGHITGWWRADDEREEM